MVKGKKGRTECCDKSQVKKGAWTAHEDSILISFIQQHGHNNWRALPKLAGLARCGKSCRLRWTNYLRPDVKRGKFTEEEEETILNLQQMMGNKWSKIASYLPGRTDNEIKNIWNSRLKKRAKPREQDSAEQSEDSPAINSSSSSSTKGKQKKRKTTESKTGDDDHRRRRRRRRRNRETDDGTETKMPRLSGDDTRPILPSNSSNSNNTYGDEFAALLFEDFVEPPDPGVIGNTQELEVNKPEIQEMRAPEAVEMPFKSDVEFWELLKSDGFNPFEEDKNGNNGVGDPENGSNLGETGTKEWLRYIENELGLEATAGEGDSDKEAKPGNPPEN